MNKNLVLTGMMAVGKSSIGKDLSNKLKMEFKDIDTIIENKLSLSISEIFKLKGEKFFRDAEEEETLNCLKNDNIVVALGGGAFINEKIRNSLSGKCVSFWLDLNAKTIFQRINNNMKRPLLNSTNTENEVKELCNAREKFYTKADYKIDCNSKNKNERIKEILEIYENI